MNVPEKINESIVPELLRILFERGEKSHQYPPIAIHPSSVMLFLSECGLLGGCERNELREYPGIIRTFGGSDGLTKENVQEVLYELSHRQVTRVIYLFENFDQSSIEVQNALLKIIEEPPEQVWIWCETSTRDGLIATILSRVILLFSLQPSTAREEYHEILLQAHQSGDLLEIMGFLTTKKWTKMEFYQFFSTLLSHSYRQNSHLSPRMIETLSKGTEELLLAKTSHKWLVDAFLLAAIQEGKK